MLAEISGIQITGICAAIPSTQLSIDKYCADLLSEKDARRLSKSTGFNKLHISNQFTFASDLCAKAAKNLLRNKDFSPSTIDGIIFVSQTSDCVLPATSHILQETLGLSKDIVCFDINEGCSGYIQGLYLSSTLLHSGSCRKILLLVGDTISKLTSPTDRATRCIFGDGGSATVIERGNDSIAYHIESFGDGASAIHAFNRRNTATSPGDGHLYLNGVQIMNFSLNKVPNHIEKLMDFQKISKSEVSFLACHQANRLILESLAEKLHIEKSKVPFYAGDIGNTSSASIPILLTQCKNSFPLENVLCSGFGVGLSIASCIVDFSKTQILDVSEV